MTDDTLTAEAALSLADSYFIDEDFALAIDAYAAAETLTRRDDIRFRSLSHKAAALLQLERYEEARHDANAALEFCCSSTTTGGLRQGETESCYKRLGQALFHLERYEEALTALEKAYQLATLNQRDVRKYESLIQKYKEKVVIAVPAKASQEAGPKPVLPLAKLATKSCRPTMPKYQYYQNDTFMKIEILEHSVREDDIRVDFTPRRLTVVLKKQGVDMTVVHGTLYDKVDVSRCKVLIKDEKVLIKLRKTEPQDWHELFGNNTDEDEDSMVVDTQEIPTIATKVRPYSSTRDWDAIERSIKTQEKSEKPEGDEAMNQLFQKIYGNASEETRRAMVKSYQTSGGTVLSTNWDEVKEKDYEGKDRVAAKGQEWKNWEGKKLPAKD